MNKKLNLLVIIFLLLNPILDVTSFLNLPFSIIIRSLFLVGIVLYLFINKKELKLLIPLLIFNIISFIYQYFYLKFGLTETVSSIFKFLYLPVSILFFKNYSLAAEKSKIETIILITYLGIYLFSYLFKIGANAYLPTDGKSGFKGLFSSINEFSAIIVCLLPIAVNYLRSKKNYIVLIIILICSSIASLLIGTKVLMGGIIFTILYLIWNEKKFFLRQSKKIKIMVISLFVILITISGFLFTKTRTYKNMQVQQDFFKVDNIFSLEFINRVIYNDRLTFLDDNYTYYKNQNIDKKLLGISINNNDIKMVEIDIFDILFRYGIVGIILFVSSIITINFKEIKVYDKISMILLVIISLTSGHVLIYPAVSIYFSLAVAKDKEGDWLENRFNNYSL